ncbi:MAG: SIS domain-containing protein [Lentisphaerae bacterium]|nr:SIS domain-containing protein [Lentisphaerota bacterium]
MNANPVDTGRLRRLFAESAAAIGALDEQADAVAAGAALVVTALQQGHAVLTAGNGGSAAEALHLAEELVGRFRANRRALPAVALVADTTALTCIANDFGYDRVFSRQVEALGRPGDVLVLFSTSGRAANLALALEAAQSRGLRTLCLLGRDGGPLAGRADAEVIVPGSATERIQEAHQVILHAILDAVEAAC